MEEEQELKKTLEEKIERVNQMLIECERLKTEWEERIEEAKTAKNNYDSLIYILTLELNKINLKEEQS